jgi:hypothetical protein
MAKIGRNDRCPCGSGKKYKQCCLAKDEAAARAAQAKSTAPAAARTAEPEPHHHPYFCSDCNAAIDKAANTVGALINAGKFDAAERAAHMVVERWPDIYDGYDCLAQVFDARGDKHQAAEYYRKVIDCARREPSLYDPEFEPYYQDLIARLEPSPSVGALPPHPRDI